MSQEPQRSIVQIEAQNSSDQGERFSIIPMPIQERSSPLQYEKVSDFEVPSNFNQIAEIIVLGGEFIVARTIRGICFAYNMISHETLIINKSKREQIKSTFLNQVNNSIFIVAVK